MQQEGFVTLGRPGFGRGALRCVVLLAVISTAFAVPVSPAAAASPPPFKVWAPWTAGRTMVVGGPGYFYGQGTHKNSDHYAVDINRSGTSDCGEPVRATANGKVKSITSSTTGYGKHVVIDHGSGYTSRYAHLQGFASGLSVGKSLGHGDVIGYIGTTGNSTGCHLHFAIYLNGSSVPPSPMSDVKLYDGVYVESDNHDVPPCTLPTGKFCGEFYDGTAASGYPQFTRVEDAIDERWGTGSPSTALGNDTFSVKWRGRFLFTSGTHRFIARADDGIRVWVDNTWIIDDWNVHTARDYSVDLNLTAGYHTIRVDYYESVENAEISFRWECPTNVDSFCAEYYPNTALAGSPRVTQRAVSVTGDWDGSAPASGVSASSFSVRWKGNFYFAPGTYRFRAAAEDGVRVWVDDRLIISDWTDHPLRNYAKYVAISGGRHDIRFEYYNRAAGAEARLTWECLGLQASYCVEYFRNNSLGGSPVSTQHSDVIANTWESSPGGGAGADNFSLRWRGRFKFAAGVHTFVARADDGMRLYVDGKKVLDEWKVSSPRTVTRNVTMTAGNHDIMFEYFDASGEATAHLQWACPTPSGYFCAEYYANDSLANNPVSTGRNRQVRHTWHDASPASTPTDGFSARWKGRFLFAGGAHMFTAQADDAIRVIVDGKRVIDDWREHESAGYAQAVTLTAGWHDVTVEYADRSGAAQVYVGWECVKPLGKFCAGFFSNTSLIGSPVMTATDSSINEAWRGSPGGSLPSNGFSARYLGRFSFKEGPHTFIAKGDDGVRVYVDDRLVIDRWTGSSGVEARVSVPIAAGRHDIKVEYREHTGLAATAVRWELRLPDAQIRRESESAYTGDNIYDAAGPGQRKSTAVRRGRSTAFWIQVQNDGNVADRYLIKGNRNTTGFSVRYYDESGRNISTAVKDGTYTTATFGPRASKRIKVVVAVASNAPVGSVKKVIITARSRSQAARYDSVAALVTALRA